MTGGPWGRLVSVLEAFGLEALTLLAFVALILLVLAVVAVALLIAFGGSVLIGAVLSDEWELHRDRGLLVRIPLVAFGTLKLVAQTLTRLLRLVGTR